MFLRRRTITVAIEQRTLTLEISPPPSVSKDAAVPPANSPHPAPHNLNELAMRALNSAKEQQ